MPVPVISTKLYVPPERENAVPRPRLIEKLSSGVKMPGRITLVSGPAGFGKTTLVSEFVSKLGQPVAWVSLDEGDNDPIQFWTYLITACQSILKDTGESVQELFSTNQALSDETVPTILINDLAAHDEVFVLVLDDYHVIQNPSIHAGLQFLLDHIPHNLQIVVSTRTDPPWSLARFRARNQLVEIRARDLRFRVEEAAEFLNRTMGLNLSVEEVAALEERTEGWIAGLQLAAIAMQSLVSLQRTDEVTTFVKAFTGSHLYVAEYLVEEVLQRQTGDMRDFLLQTSILNRMSAGLCAAVTGCQNAQDILQFLRHANLFVIPLDSEGIWFRYHHLFADLLQARLRDSQPIEAVHALHRRAASWYERSGDIPEAIHHAFSAEDYEHAARLVDRAGQVIVFGEGHNRLKSWLDALPDEAFRTHPRLEIYRLLIDLSKGTLDMFEQTLLEKEKLIQALPPSPENDRLKREAMVNLSLFYAFQNTARAIEIAEEALDDIPEDDLKMCATLYSAFYRAYGMEGDIEKSAQAYRESLRLSQAVGQYSMISNTTMIRAFDLCQYGRLDEAARYCQVIIEAGSEQKQKNFYAAGPSYIGLAGIHLERNDLVKAEEYLTRGLELCRQGAMHGLFTGYVQKCRLLQAKGELEEALKMLQYHERTFQRKEFTLMARKVSLLLAMGDLQGASSLVSSLLEILGDSHYAHELPLIAAEAFKLSLARIYIALRKNEKAFRLLDEIQATVGPDGRFGRLLEVYLLRALALQKQDEGQISNEAVVSLERALDLAQAPGFVMLFLEEGPALVPLLRAVVSQRSAPDPVKKYARKLLEAFGEHNKDEIPGLVSETAGIVEPLTRREREVLALIAAGDSNQAIADKLFITVRTVKKHSSNIYGKLNASSRIHAVALARELGLLSPD